MQARFVSNTFYFRQPSGTSRGILHDRKSWFLVIGDKNNSGKKGVGECAPLKGLSIDDRADFENVLAKVCSEINNYAYWLKDGLKDFPSIKFGLEAALLDFCNSGSGILYPSAFTDGTDSIRINGLIWMGDLEVMKKQVEEKIAAGFRCIKMKIGALDFDKELSLLKFIRENYTDDLELRLDANGAFSPKDALFKLERLSEFKIHSVEQPIRQGQWEEMQQLCKKTPIPIALDEELIGIQSKEEKRKLLIEIMPQYIILKPTLVGGFSESLEWIKLASELKIGWWVTSALESNVGLNAIAQWTYTLGNPMPQGLGTGQLYTNNIDSPLYLKGEHLYFNPHGKWEFPPELA